MALGNIPGMSVELPFPLGITMDSMNRGFGIFNFVVGMDRNPYILIRYKNPNNSQTDKSDACADKFSSTPVGLTKF